MDKQNFSKAVTLLISAHPRLAELCSAIPKNRYRYYEGAHHAVIEFLIHEKKCPRFNVQDSCYDIKHQVEDRLGLYVPQPVFLAALHNLGFPLKLSWPGPEPIFTCLAPIEPDPAFVHARRAEHEAILAETPVVETDEYGVEVIL